MNYLELAAFWLGTAPGIGAAKAQRLVQAAGSVEALFLMDKEEMQRLAVVGKKDVDALFLPGRRERIQREYEALQKKGIHYVSRYGMGYPEKLRSLYEPPLQLYVRGELPKECGLAIAIVGARECTCYGRDMARMFAFRLAKAGVYIISGMARGVDGWAHQGALEAGGLTYAVLGCGVDICYPRIHAGLYQSITKHGGILSEYPPGTQARPPFFPRRNRIISGLSDGILLVEAGQKSGSLITVEAALEQGRDVFVIPGRIGDTLSEGCNRLIVQGALPVLSPEDILDFYGTERNGEKGGCDGAEDIGELDEKIYRKLIDAPVHIDMLCSDMGETATDVMKALLRLAKAGKVRELSRGYYMASM